MSKVPEWMQEVNEQMKREVLHGTTPAPDDVKLPEGRALECLIEVARGDADELLAFGESEGRTIHDLCDALEKVRELEADAARLDFVEREGLLCGAWYSADADGEGFLDGYFCEKPETGDEALGPTLRDAIDSARKAVEVEDD